MTELISVPANIAIRGGQGRWIRTEDATDRQIRDHIRFLKASAVVEEFEGHAELDLYPYAQSAADLRDLADGLKRWLEAGRPRFDEDEPEVEPERLHPVTVSDLEEHRANR